MSADEGVEEDINLNLITDEQLDKLEAQADRLEVQASRIKSATKDLGGAPGDIGGEGGDPAAGGIFGGDTGKSVGFAQGQKIGGGVERLRDTFSKAAFVHENPWDEMIEKHEETQKKIISLQSRLLQAESKITSGITQGLGAVRDPFGFMKTQAIGRLARFAIPIGAAIAIATTVFEMVKAQFGPGGLFDIRKLILDETREYMSQSDLIDIDRGTIFFATANTINQRAAEFSNTEKKVDGQLKDILRNAGQ